MRAGAILALLAGCGPGEAVDGASSDREPVEAGVRVGQATNGGRVLPPVIADWDARRCGDDEYKNAAMQRHPDLIGRSREALTAAFGQPASNERFRAGDAVGTRRGGISSLLPGGAARNADRILLEMVWRRSGCDFIVFFAERNGQWQVIDGFEASADADF